MAETFEIRELYLSLERDSWRDQHPFSEDVATASKLLNHPFATDGDREAGLSLWLQKRQPCLFGRIAARDFMHYTFITDADLLGCDQHIGSVIRAGVLAWKRRSLRPEVTFSTPAHGFMLVLLSDRLALARPDKQLSRLAERVRALWGCPSTTGSHGTVYFETLYLENPADRSVVKFTFSVDFFAAQGDGRWWHDHRVPAGIAFTANSVGHMRRYREWYEKRNGQVEWVLKTAMGTIDLATQTAYGKATWLKDLSNGRPVVDRIACPFADPSTVKEGLRNKDWTRYGGHLHTDHSIRSEFFDERPDKSPQVMRKEYLQDFAYLYDVAALDHVRFVAGQNVSREEVVSEIGDPESFSDIVGPRVRSGGPMHPEVRALLEACRAWELSESERADLE